MNKCILVAIFIASLLPVYSYSKDSGVTCGDMPCDDVAENVVLVSTSQRKIIYKNLGSGDIKIPLFADITTISSSLITGKNSFQDIYHYGEAQSISVAFFDEDYVFDLFQESKEVSVFKNGNAIVYFYEAGNSKGHHLEPIFEAVIPITLGNKERFIKYVARAIPKADFTSLLAHLVVNDK